MVKKFHKQIALLFGLGIQDIEQSGDASIRHLLIKADGTEYMFPPPHTVGVSLNLHSDSARMYHKRTMQLQVEKGDLTGTLLLYNNMVTKPGELLDNPNGQSLYVLCMTIDGKIVVRQDYTTDEAGKLVLGERTVIDHDPEDNQLVYGANAEVLISFTDEQFAAIPEEMWTDNIPKEWVDYVHQERQNRNKDDWFSPVSDDPLSSRPLAKQGGQHEVLAAEETV